jgi:hypothetical protein
MRDSPRPDTNGSDALLGYVQQHRTTLDLVKFTELLNSPQVDINAHDQKGNTVLHILFKIGGTFPYVQQLLKKGANIGITNNNGESAFDIAKSLGKSQPHLMFLSLAATQQQKLPTASSTSILFDVSQDPKNKYKKIFKKLSDNYFDFSALEWGEFFSLYQIKEMNTQINLDIANNNLLDSEQKKQIQLYSDLGLTTPETMKIFQEFVSDFAGVMAVEYERRIQEEEKCKNQIHPIQMMVNVLSDIPIALPKDVLDMIEDHLGKKDATPAKLSLKEAFSQEASPKTAVTEQVVQKLSLKNKDTLIF